MNERTVQDLEAALDIGGLDIDTEAIISTIRRRAITRRRLRVIGSATAAALVVIGAAVPATILLRHHNAAPPATNPTVAVSPTSVDFSHDCTVALLPLPSELVATGDPATSALQSVDMDSAGRYILGRVFISGAPPNGGVSGDVLWDNGVPELLRVNEDLAQAVAVNAHGVVTGFGGGDGPTDVWLYDGALTRLPLPAGFHLATPNAISDQGEVAGVAVASDGSGVRAVVWDAAHAPRVLPPPADASPDSDTEAVAFGGGGLVVGTVMSSSLAMTPYVWSSDGTGRWLPIPSGYLLMSVSAAVGDWAVGLLRKLEDAGSTLVTVRWNLRTGEIFMVDGSATLPWKPGVNQQGDLVTTLGVSGSGRAVLVRDGRMYDLPLPPGVTHGGAVLVNDGATIIAGSNAGKPAIWHC